jgi:hypothetical protein
MHLMGSTPGFPRLQGWHQDEWNVVPAIPRPADLRFLARLMQFPRVGIDRGGQLAAMADLPDLGPGGAGAQHLGRQCVRNRCPPPLEPGPLAPRRRRRSGPDPGRAVRRAARRAARPAPDPPSSFFQLDNVRKARARGEPWHLIVHEDVLIFRAPGKPLGSALPREVQPGAGSSPRRRAEERINTRVDGVRLGGHAMGRPRQGPSATEVVDEVPPAFSPG